MDIGTRVKHPVFNYGTVICIMFKDTRRESYLVEFDVPNEKLHGGILGTEKNCWYCSEYELEVVE